MNRGDGSVAGRAWFALALAVAVGAVASCGSGRAGSVGLPDPKAEAGRRLALRVGCMVCHTADGSAGAGRTFKGLAGSTVVLEDGSSVTADSAFIARSIRDPQAQIDAGFSTQMPTVELTDEQVDQLVAYVESLRQ